MTDTASPRSTSAAGEDARGYVRFIILSAARTGSHMLAQALNTSPNIVCFREVFNTSLPIVQFGVEGYDDSDPGDIELRNESPLAFLRQRIFCPRPKETQAVGFKFHHGHQWGVPGVLDELVADKDLRVLDLRRRNVLRMLVSLRMAERTGVWLRESPKTSRSLLRRPARALLQRWKRLRRPKPASGGNQVRLTIQPDELAKFVLQTEIRSANFAELFRDHPSMMVSYEEMADRPDEVFRGVQDFLGVKARPLTVRTRHQNPEPLHELIDNYEELSDAFRGTPQEEYFD